MRGRGHNRVDGRVFVVEANRDRAVLPGIVDQVAAIGREHELHAQLLGGLAERPRLVSRSRRKN